MVKRFSIETFGLRTKLVNGLVPLVVAIAQTIPGAEVSILPHAP